jgi:hypothetical protein
MSTQPGNGESQSAAGQITTPQMYNNELHEFLGPTNQPYNYNPEDNRLINLATISKIYEGKSAWIRTMVRGLLADTENEWVFGLMPIEEIADMTLTTQAYEFPGYIAPVTPSQSGPQFGSWKRNQVSTKTQRFAFGVQTLIDPTKTDEGLFILEGLTIQAVQAIVRHLEAGALMAIINTRSAFNEFWLNSASPKIKVTTRIYVEHKTWNFLKEKPDGIQVLASTANAEMAVVNKAEITGVIIGEGVRALIASSIENRAYYFRGPGNNDINDRRGDAASLKGLLLKTNIRVYVAAAINAKGSGVNLNFLKQRVQIGGYGIMFDTTRGKGHYESWKTNIGMMSMEADNFVLVTADYGINNCERWDESPMGYLSAKHDTLAKNPKQFLHDRQLPFDAADVDMFLYDIKVGQTNEFTKTAVLGHMNAKSLTKKAIDGIASSELAYVLSEMTAEEIADFKMGNEVLALLADREIRSADLAFNALSAPEPLSGADRTNTIATGGRFGPRLPQASEPGLIELLRVPTAAAPNANYLGEAYFPLGFASPEGFIEIGTTVSENSVTYGYLSPTVVKGARAYTIGWLAFWKVLVGVHGKGHKLLDPLGVPPAFMSSAKGEDVDQYRGVINLAHNLSAGNPSTVMLKRSVLAPGAAPASFPVLVAAANPDEELLLPLRAMFGKLNLAGEVNVSIRQALGTKEAAINFIKKFEGSPFAVAYKAYLVRLQAMGQNVMPAETSLLAKMYALDIVPYFDDGDTEQNFYVLQRVLTAVIEHVNRGTTVTVNRTLFANWVSGYPEYKAQRAKITGQLGASKDFYATRLIIPAQRIFDYNKNIAQADRTIGIASPQGDGATITGEVGFVNKSAITDLRNATIHSGEHLPRQQVQAASDSARTGNIGQSAPAFQRDLGTDFAKNPVTGKTVMVINKNLLARWIVASKITNVMQRIITQLLLTQQITREFAILCYEKDIRLFMEFIILRPFKEYETMATVWLAAGNDLGMTGLAFFDVRTGVDIIRKSVTTHMSGYSASLVTDPRRVLLMPHTLVTNYFRGEETDAIKAKDFKAAAAGVRNSVNKGAAIYVAVPVGTCTGTERRLHGTLDIRGQFSHQLYQFNASESDAVLLQRTQQHYPGAAFTSLVYNFAGLETESVLSELRFKADSSFANTMCSQELQQVFVDDQHNAYYIAPADHWGYNTGPGQAEKRKSMAFAEINEADVSAIKHRLLTL